MRDSRSSLLPAVDVVVIEQLLRLLSAGQRLEILRLLSERPHYVNELADGLFQRVDAVSRDLHELRGAGLVIKQHEGTRRRYSLTARVGVRGDEHGNQIAVTTKNGDWLLAHVHGAVDDMDMIAPPVVMVGRPLWPQRITKAS